MAFDAEKVKNDIVRWIREWFEENGKGCPAVIGLSGGKDSSIVAALCVEALGADRVFGVMMPNGKQFDIDVSHALAEHLGIRAIVFNIRDAYDGVVGELMKHFDEFSAQAKTNLPPRLRMAVLYAVSQNIGGRVANTCNLSEDWVGYNTKYGDGAGDFSPLSKLTVQEVKAVGRALGLPPMFVDKVPIDGLQAKTDEDNLGFTYTVLDRYIREGVCEDEEIHRKIDEKHRANLFKLQPMPCFPYEGA
ncbi:MAG: NAD(+) synthase [Bacillota bacterium]|nr:NAD(+) synthase [Bacillota bacterium]